MTPLVRHLFSWMGIIDAREGNVLEQIKTYDICVMPGGIAEMLESEFKQERVYVSRHMGYCRVALKTGSSIVPLYTLGTSVCMSVLLASCCLLTTPTD
jgi:hypothetical protein